MKDHRCSIDLPSVVMLLLAGILLFACIPSAPSGPGSAARVSGEAAPGPKRFTAADLVFATVVDQDRELATGPRAAGYAYVEDVVAVDPQTVRVIWNRPYIDADTMFTNGFASPLPKHLLDEAYQTDKARFVNL